MRQHPAEWEICPGRCPFFQAELHGFAPLTCTAEIIDFGADYPAKRLQGREEQ